MSFSGTNLRPGLLPDASPQSPVSVAAAPLVQEMSRAWRRGSPVSAEEMFARHPEARANPQVAVRLIYEEICLRQEAGQEGAAEEVLRRFPQWRDPLEMLLDCHQLLQPAPPPAFAGAGERLGDFRLLAELGRGAQGRVYLAAQPALADRPVVLKVTLREGREHLTLARLQHAHIVPLYLVQDFPDQDLQGLCMPYLGGLTLDALLKELAGVAPGLRTGRHVQEVLDWARERAPVGLPERGPVREFLTRSSFAEAVCWVGACLADALQHAHERGLVHLDIKPSNVLLAADGQPMLLDFHLAREPLSPAGPVPEWLGGTQRYIAPEQQAALRALAEGRPVPGPVDGRADLYALGLVLYEALGGSTPLPPGEDPGRLRRSNPQVSPALADVLRKCLKADPGRRYPTAAALAGDLRRHLAHLPLRGVANRSLRERWQKWRRRRPQALPLAGVLLLLVAACLGAGAHLAAGYGQQLRLARSDLDEGQRQLKEGHPTEAVRTFQRGLSRARDLPGQGELAGELARLLLVAERAEAAADLHQLAERLRFVCGGDAPPPRSARQLEERCRTAWEGRRFLANRQRAEETVRADLLDLAILWADLGVRLAPPGRDGDARRHALRLLDEAETLLGPHPALRRERRNHSRLLGLPGSAPAGDDRQLPRTAWECTALGRSLLRSGRLEEATGVLERALGLHPQDFWLNFYQGLCTYRLENYHRALAHFHACVVLAPASPECLYNRALTLAALGQPRRALRDYDRALQLNHHFAAAALNRGLLNYQRQHYAAALAGFQKALDSGADPARAHYNLALTYLALGNRAAALAHLERALGQNPGHREARLLRESLLSRK